MLRQPILNPLATVAFDFFYAFSRFEFALKENKYLRDARIGGRVQPDWNGFSRTFSERYMLSSAAKHLLALDPKVQVLGPTGIVEWRAQVFKDGISDLDKVVHQLKNVRNNLFHGGKHSVEGWDEPKRTEELLRCCIEVLGELAKLGTFEHDFTRFY